ncbi:hypothetical protein CEXT_423771 [Caerostris extrusa]|uniref:Uncharacterized protein n=1 Tax=Caerostris extrusa TaxID=172846 RepID=A0AAV4Y127_CAEEX|nr:hypothetical protein CEXT_423771 [Caerostris extrusa]
MRRQSSRPTRMFVDLNHLINSIPACTLHICVYYSISVWGHICVHYSISACTIPYLHILLHPCVYSPHLRLLLHICMYSLYLHVAIYACSTAYLHILSISS